VTVSRTSMDNFCNRVIGNINLKITSGKDEKGETFSIIVKLIILKLVYGKVFSSVDRRRKKNLTGYLHI
jgi:hypothetical protein